MFETRGFMLDTGRGRVPTMRTLMLVVDILARYRYNRFQLYTGQASGGGSGCGEEGDSSIPPAEIAKLDAYCRMQGIELVANAEFRFDPLFWADDVLKHPQLASSVPKDAIALVRGDEADHPFEKEAALLKEAGIGFWVCPGTSAPRSLAGRVENMRDNLERAEKAGRENGAKGFLLADWGDEASWQPLAASLPAIILGGNFAASGRKAAHMDVERELDSVMDAPLGGLLLRLGTLYLCGGAVRRGSSELFNILAGPVGYSRHPGLTQHVLDEISGVAAGVRIAAEKWCDRSDWAKEIVYMANMIDCACHRRDESRLRALRDEHGRIWRMRSREDGRADSLSKLPRF